MRDIAEADVAVFCGMHPARRAFAPSSADGDSVANWAGAEFDESGPIVRWFQVNEETLRLPDENGAERFIDAAGRRVIEARSVRACIPLLTAGQLLGIVLIASGRPDSLVSREQAAFLTACGRQAALAVEAAMHHELEIARVRAAERAERLAVAGQLAATVAHEVRNPLTIIRSTLQMVCNSSRPLSELTPMVSDLVVEIDRIDRIVGGLLTLGHPAEPRDEPFDLGQVVVDSVRLLRAHAEIQQIAIDMVEPLPLPVQGDADQLRQVFLNLLNNACDAMPLGGRLSIEAQIVGPAESGRDAGLSARIRIGDSGQGMPQAVLSRTFDPFFTTKEKGTGLGLFVSLGLVQRHGGDLRLTSEAGRGTIATVMLPLREQN